MRGHDEPHHWSKVVDAANQLGISPSTVRRFVKAGKLEGRTLTRPQGTAIRVLLPAEPQPPSRVDDPADGDAASLGGHDSAVATSQGNSLQQALAALDSIPFTKLRTESLISLEVKLDQYHKAVQLLLQASRLLSEGGEIE